MNILLVDNGTRHPRKLKRLLDGNRLRTVRWKTFKKGMARGYDLVILSGGRKNTPWNNNQEYLEEAAFVKQTKKPVLGICLGFELIAWAFGAELEKMARKKRGVVSIRTVGDNTIFANIPDLKVFEAHRWVVKKLSSQLTKLAVSKYGIEAIKHRHRPIYGFQFHPEMLWEETAGNEIFENFFKIINKNIA